MCHAGVWGKIYSSIFTLRLQLEESGQIHVSAALPVPTEYYTVWVPDGRSGRFKGENNPSSLTSNPGPGSH